MRHLSSNQECFHEFAFAADDHAGESLEPFDFGNLGIGIEPRGEGHDVRPRDFPFAGMGQQVLKRASGSLARRTLGISGDRKTLP